MDILHLHLKLGASPQLEFWNIGKLECWVRNFDNIPISRILQIFNTMHPQTQYSTPAFVADATSAE
jgi:hypothetical protein